MYDLAHALTHYCLVDLLTKKFVSFSLFVSTIQTGVLREVDTHPLFRTTMQHKAFVTQVICPHPDAPEDEDHWAHLMCGPVHFKLQKGTNVSHLLKEGGKFPLTKDPLTGKCYIYAVGPDGTLTSSTTIDKSLLSLEDMTGFIVFEMRESSRLSDYWQQRTKSQLCRVHVTPKKTLFTPSRAPVDLALLAPCRETHKSYLNGSTLTLCDTWLGNSKGRDCEEWAGDGIYS